MAKKRSIPTLATPPELKIKGKPVETVVVKAQKPTQIDITASQLMNPGENPDHQRLSSMFKELCKQFNIEPTNRQARKARQGVGAWSNQNPLTPLIRKVA